VAIKLGPGEAYGVNNLGEVVGQSRNAQGHDQAVLWRAGEDPIFLDFITTDPLDQLASAAHVINEAGIIAGYSRYSWDPNVTGQYPDPPIYPFLRNDVYGGSGATDTHACLWRIVRPRAGSNIPLEVTAPQDLNDLSLGGPANPDLPDPANKGRSFAFDINQAGTAVGYSTSRVTTGKFVFYWLIGADLDRAVRFNASGAPAQLQMPTHPDRPSYATAISDHSIAGSGAGEQGRSAFLFSNGTLQLIDAGGEFLGLQNYASVHGLNIHDHIVGSFGTYGSAAIWVNESNLPGNERFVNLTTVPGLEDGRNINAAKINDYDQVVGSAELSQGTEAILWQNGKAFRLNQLIGSLPIGHRLVSATAISRDGLITANTNNGDAYLLVPLELITDHNRDGIIDDKDCGKVTTEKPWRFWINDDDDAGAVDGNDIPGMADSDAKDAGLGTFYVDGMRDLVDFFPLYLDLKQMVEVLPPADFSYFLKHQQGALNFAYTDLKPGGGNNERAGAYLKHLGVAQLLQSAEAFQISATGVQLTTAFLNKIKDEGKGVILIEGRSPTDKPLVLEVRERSEKIAELSFEVKIAPVEQMYRHKNLMAADGASGGKSDYATGTDIQRLEPEDYPDSVCNGKTFVFVHGYNVNPESARGWNAEMFKRLHQSGSKAKFIGTTWNGAETQIPGMEVTVNYHKNVDHAFQTAKGTGGTMGLASYISSLGPDTVVAAHSLGNIAVASALSDWDVSINTYFMIDAAVPLEAFDLSSDPTPANPNMVHPQWLDYRKDGHASEWHKLFGPADGRSKLTWRGRLSNLQGTIYNFYSSREEVLAEHPNTLGDPSILDIAYTNGRVYLGKYAWALQEKLKGRIHDLQSFPIVGSVYGGWGFTQNFGHPPHIPSSFEAGGIAESALQTEPIFDPGYKVIEHSPSPDYPFGYTTRQMHSPTWVADLTDPEKGSETAGNHLNTLLTEMFPAITAATGANKLVRIGESKNMDMQTEFKSGWPAERPDSDWRHSDIKEVAYPYIHLAFDQIVTLGNLK
jgi:hypothetical protein